MAKSSKAIFGGKVFCTQGAVKPPAHSVVEIIMHSHHKLIIPARLKEHKGFSERLDDIRPTPHEHQ
jgi:hypothetical protein